MYAAVYASMNAISPFVRPMRRPARQADRRAEEACAMPTESSMPFGALLQGHRRATGLTQAELAERAGLSWRGVADLERGARRAPRRDTVARLARALALTSEERAHLEVAARQPWASSASAAQAATHSPVPDSALMAEPDTHAHRLPVQPTPLLGREREMAAVMALLRQDDVRLVTLTGPAGVGKTRLALESAAALAGAFDDGVWFVRLAPIADPGLVIPTIARTLGLQEVWRMPIQAALREWLRPRRLLLLLDNCEQVAAAAPEVADLLASCPGLKALATSRAPLRLRGERTYPVPPLDLPDPRRLPEPERLAEYASVAVFLQRARDAQPDFILTAANAPVLAEICARLDGLPLAIELAAARIRLLSPAQLLQRLERRLPLLTGGARDLEEHQRTLRATLAWSEDLLSPAERRLFHRLAVFVGGFTLEAAEAVCATPAGADPLGMDVLEGLGRLMDHSLVEPQARDEHETEGEGERAGDERKGDSAVRFHLLYVVREYALERLEAYAGGREAEAMRRAHATYFLGMVEGQEVAMYERRTGPWVSQLEQERHNFRAALAWAREQGEVDLGLRLAGALVTFWDLKGYHTEGSSWLEGLLALAGEGGLVDGGQASDGGSVATATMASTPPAVLVVTRAKALLGAGVFARRAGNYGRASAALEASLALARDQQPGWIAGLALGHLGHIARRQGDLEQATTYIEEGVKLLQADAEPIAGVFLSDLGHIVLMRGDLKRAEAYFEESLTLARRVGADFCAGFPLAGLAQLALARGDLERAAAYFEENLALTRRVGADFWQGHVLAGLAHVARLRGDLAQAARLAREQLVTWRGVVVPTYFAGWLESFSLLAASAGQGAKAARLLGAAAAWREMVGEAQAPQWRAEIEQVIAPARAALGETAWAPAFTAGQALTLEEAIDEALNDQVLASS
jgi:predicted ATPase/transcriptional regulator with XRE-family HTH domain